MHPVHTKRIPLIPFWALALLLLIYPQPGRAGLPDTYKNAHFDWVLVAPDALLAQYAPLAAHRSSQGLNPLLVGMEELNRWSPHPENSPETLRWLATVACEQWHAQYLVLGGSHAVLPAPIHRLVTGSGHTWDSPTDAYFRCLAGDWDLDGDGFYAEWNDDAADPTVHITVGRLPVDDPQSAAHIVAKILAFEERSSQGENRALFVSSLMDPQWTPADPYPNWSLQTAMNMREWALEQRPSLLATTLWQGDELVDPIHDPLNPFSLADSLGSKAQDLVYIQLRADPQFWQLAGYLNITSSDLESLAHSGHAFVGVMLSNDVADSREEGCILADIMGLPEGGPVAMVAPTGTGFITYSTQIIEAYLACSLGGEAARLGDAFDLALADLASTGLTNYAMASTYWSQSLQGDPAMLLARPEPTSAAPAALSAMTLQAAPNPFNPQTSLRFEVPDTGAERVPVKLEIFDLHGRLVETLVDRSLAPGPRTQVWGGTTAGGVYLARLQVAGHEVTTKLTLVD